MVFDLPEATLLCLLGMMIESVLGSVSYTHLDVYKRQL